MRTANRVYDCTRPVTEITLPRARVTTIRSAATAALLCLALACAPRAFGEAPDTVYLEELTWTEVRDLVRAGKSTIIVPIGGTEQNGPHMALGKHNARVRILSSLIARGLGNALVAPVIAYVPEGQLSPPTGHMRFPGTITVPDDVFQKGLEWTARSFVLHGFRDVVFLGDHGSTQAGQKAVAARLNREWAGAPARAHAIEEYYRASEDGLKQAPRRARLSAGGSRRPRGARRYVAHAGARSAARAARSAAAGHRPRRRR